MNTLSHSCILYSSVWDFCFLVERERERESERDAHTRTLLERSKRYVSLSKDFRVLFAMSKDGSSQNTAFKTLERDEGPYPPPMLRWRRVGQAGATDHSTSTAGPLAVCRLCPDYPYRPSMLGGPDLQLPLLQPGVACDTCRN